MSRGLLEQARPLLLQQLGFNWVSQKAASIDPNLGQLNLDQKSQSLNQSENRKALFFTTYSEPNLKLLQHMAQFSFFDEAMFSERLKFLSLTGVIEEDPELKKAADTIVTEARTYKATMVLLDSLGSLEDLGEGRSAVRRFLYRLSSQLSMLGINLIISLERDILAPNRQKELTVADGIISLSTQLQGANRTRYIEISKLRGMNILMGLHSYRLSRDGFSVFPRMESRITKDSPGDEQPQPENTLNLPGEPERLKFDLPELEQVFGGGLTAGSSTVISGSPGTGKTLISLYFLLAGVRAGEPGLYFGFRENKTQLLQKARRFGLDLQTPLQQGLIDIITFPPVEMEPDFIATKLQQAIEAHEVKRLVVDTLGELEQACKPQQRSLSFSNALQHYLKSLGITTLYNLDISKLIGSELDLSETAFPSLAENLLLLRQVEYQAQLYRILAVLKMRDSAYDNHIRQFVIESGSGLKVLDPLSSAQGLLSGIARMVKTGSD
ncbi:MAG TPA: ATPase domain-containing protein [Chloroflexia bacterium]|nr:ATPase domain-containing protein [Chloroflexia bacterium]